MKQVEGLSRAAGTGSGWTRLAIVHSVCMVVLTGF